MFEKGSKLYLKFRQTFAWESSFYLHALILTVQFLYEP